jgi:hypothetical protein
MSYLGMVMVLVDASATRCPQSWPLPPLQLSVNRICRRKSVGLGEKKRTTYK